MDFDALPRRACAQRRQRDQFLVIERADRLRRGRQRERGAAAADAADGAEHVEGEPVGLRNVPQRVGVLQGFALAVVAGYADDHLVGALLHHDGFWTLDFRQRDLHARDGRLAGDFHRHEHAGGAVDLRAVVAPFQDKMVPVRLHASPQEACRQDGRCRDHPESS